jgi:hypothetical protein
MTDVLLTNTADGGEISYVNGQAQMSDGLDNFFYLCLFGGNEQDSGLANDPAEYWANKDETTPARKMRSETQFLLRSLPSVSSNLTRLRDAVLRDCQSAKDIGLAETVDARVTIPALNTVKIEIAGTINDKTFSYAFTEAWRARAG